MDAHKRLSKQLEHGDTDGGSSALTASGRGVAEPDLMEDRAMGGRLVTNMVSDPRTSSPGADL